MLEEQIGEFVDNRKDTVQEQCRVCGDPAAGFHFGVFTCEGCKSFFGRAHQKKLLSECKNKGKCDVNRNTRTKCKLCRLQKCLSVGMSKEASRYGRRSTYFKVHCMAEKQAKQKLCKSESLLLTDSDSSGTSPSYVPSLPPTPAAMNPNTNGNLPCVEKIMSGSPFPTRPVPCYPTYGYNPFMYVTPINFSSQISLIEQKSFPFNDCNINEQQIQSTPLDLSQKSSRMKNGALINFGDNKTSSSMIIKKTFDYTNDHHHNHHLNHLNHHHNHSTNQGYVR